MDYGFKIIKFNFYFLNGRRASTKKNKTAEILLAFILALEKNELLPQFVLN